MPSLEDRLTAWRRALAASGAVRPWQLDELEDHLLTTLERAREEFPSEAQAWNAAMERTGSVPLITREFAKEHVMNPLSKLAGIGITLGLLWLVIATGPGAGSFLHLPSLLFVLAFVVGGVGVATCTLSIFYGALLAEVLFANGRQWLAARARVSP